MAPPLVVVAFVISPLLTAFALVVVPALIGLAILLRRRVVRDLGVWHEAFRHWAGHVQVTLRTMPLIRSRSADAAELDRGRSLIGAQAIAVRAKNLSQNDLSIAQRAVSGAAGAVILTVGGLAVAAGDLPLPDLIAFYAVMGLLLRTVSGGSGTAGPLVAGLESLKALLAIVDDATPAPYPDDGPDPETLGTLALRGVTFGYGEEAVLHDVDFELAPGEHVALVGPNGAGKSTVALLLLGLYRPWSGAVTAGGRPYDALDVTELRRHVGYVPQDPMLRPGTLRDNIAFGRPEADLAEVMRVSAIAGVDAYLDSLEDGFDTDLGNDGARLSGGERQRVAVARALLCSPQVLILDEPTNHLDAETVQRLMRTLDGLRPAPAVLVITHDRALADWAHRQIEIHAGRVLG